MTDSEKRELDAWLTRLFPEIRFEGVEENDPHSVHGDSYLIFNPTSDDGCAMAVLKKCASKLCEIQGATVSLQIYGNDEGGWVIWFGDDEMETDAQTLPETIGLFARKLFSK